MKTVLNFDYLFHSCQSLREFRETQGILKLNKMSGKLRKTQGSFGFFWQFQGSLEFYKSQGKFFLDLEWDLVKAIGGLAMFFESWSYFINFLLSFKMLFTVLKN